MNPRSQGKEPAEDAQPAGAGKGTRTQPIQGKTPLLRDVTTVLRDLTQLNQKQAKDHKLRIIRRGLVEGGALGKEREEYALDDKGLL